MKIFKKIVAVISAVVMLSCATAVTASASSTTIKWSDGGAITCYSYQSTPRQWYIATSYSIGNCAVYCSGVGTYYTSITRLTATTGGGNSSGTSGTSATLFNNNGYGWKDCVSDHSATATDGSSVSKKGWRVQGDFVN